MLASFHLYSSTSINTFIGQFAKSIHYTLTNVLLEITELRNVFTSIIIQMKLLIRNSYVIPCCLHSKLKLKI